MTLHEDEHIDPDRRLLRPRMSIGGIASLVAMIVTLIGGIHYFDTIINKLDFVAEQVRALGDVKNDVAKLQTRMDGLEGWFRFVLKDTPPPRVTGPAAPK